MKRKPRRSFIVRVLPGSGQPLAKPNTAGSQFWVQDLKTGEQREFNNWEELKGFLEHRLPRRLR
jgi:hypothetical protein